MYCNTSMWASVSSNVCLSLSVLAMAVTLKFYFLNFYCENQNVDIRFIFEKLFKEYYVQSLKGFSKLCRNLIYKPREYKEFKTRKMQ